MVTYLSDYKVTIRISTINLLVASGYRTSLY